MTKMNGTRREKRYPIMEIFGPTIQGEGLMAGTITNFIRTGGCGLKCVWCDTMFAVDPKQVRAGRTMLSLPEILDKWSYMPYAPYLTLSGGDPCLHKDLGDMIPFVNSKNTRVAIETQGSEFPDWLEKCDVVTFSPKPPSSGNTVHPEGIINWIKALGPKRRMQICIKIVVFTIDDMKYAFDVFRLIPAGFYDSFYFTAGTPIAKDETVVLEPLDKVVNVLEMFKRLATTLLMEGEEYQLNEKVHVGCQQHVLLWPEQEQGV